MPLTVYLFIKKVFEVASRCTPATFLMLSAVLCLFLGLGYVVPVSFQLFPLRHAECFASELSALLVVAYRFFFRCVVEHFFFSKALTLFIW
jgi:hypothetical protein